MKINFTNIHANTPEDACVRLETLCLMGDTKIPPDAIKKMIGSAINIIVQTARFSDGGRRTSHISEILGVDQYGRYIVRDIFRWKQRGVDEKTGKFLGEVVPCNYIPTFFNDIVVNKLPFPKKNFIAPDWVNSIKKAA